jgi:aminoglycoside phosphotransferase (APT) family kinase protein
LPADLQDRQLPAEVRRSLVRLGLLARGSRPSAERLTGGVSSDIWKADLVAGPVCIKRALPRLRVDQVWEAPVERNIYEVRYFETVGQIVPEAVPKVLAVDAEAGLFVMEYLDAATHPLWKRQLLDGIADRETAAVVGSRLGRIHAATAHRLDVAERFPTGAIFHAIRLEPYLLATARRHPDLASRLEALTATTARTRLALVHGDVSPKNILVGPHGPLLLDAECAWFGDPAFDVAFCLNHLLLKCAWRRDRTDAYLKCYDALAEGYLAEATWEPRDELERRTASLLPGLLLARVDGKSPVEYITRDDDRDRVRRVARELLQEAVASVSDIAARWRKEVRR